MNQHLARTVVATALTAAAVAVAGCGGSSSDTTTGTTTGTQATATVTQTQTATGGSTTTAPAQREAVVTGKQARLKSGDIGLDIKVTKVADPVAASVDRAQPGNKLVGVFVKGQTKGIVEPTKTQAVTSLQTTDGKVAGVRIIADGDCGGGFSVNDLLLTQKPVSGCIGFEVPKSATPKSITITLASPSGQQQATWSLPKAR